MNTIFSGKISPAVSAVTVIMAGGQGTRFWPLSRAARPKQYLALTDSGNSLIQDTARRIEELTTKEGVLVVTSGTQRMLVHEHLPEAAVLTEPVGKNTAPCIGYAAKRILKSVGDVPMICVPADHLIKNSAALLAAYRIGIEISKAQDVLVTIGIHPTYPETGYGYIQVGEKYSHAQSMSQAAHMVKRFVEKPDRETARKYLESGDYFWNSGMFIWRPSVVLEAIRIYLPKLSRQLDEIEKAFDSPHEAKLISELYFAIEPVSIDVGIMEQAENTIVIPGLDFGWSDVGSWSAWADCLSERADENANVTEQSEAYFVNSRRCAIYGDNRAVALVGLEDVIVVEAGDALLVCHRNHAQEVKEVVDRLKDKKREELL